MSNNTNNESKTEPSTPVLTPRGNNFSNKIHISTGTKSVINSTEKVILERGGKVIKMIKRGNNDYEIHWTEPVSLSSIPNFSLAVKRQLNKITQQGGKRKTKRGKRKQTICLSKKGKKTRCVVRYY